MLIPPNPATDCKDFKNTKTFVIHRLQLVSVCPIIILMTSSLWADRHYEPQASRSRDGHGKMIKTKLLWGGAAELQGVVVTDLRATSAPCDVTKG